MAWWSCRPSRSLRFSIRCRFGGCMALGNKTSPLLERIGIVTLRDLRLAPDATLRSVFGKYTSQMKARAAGEDDRPVIPDYDEKQISSETTFDKDIVDPSQLHAELVQLADRTAARLRSQGWLSERVTVKIRRHDFKTYTRQCAVRPATQETKPLAAAAAKLLDEWIAAQPSHGDSVAWRWSWRSHGSAAAWSCFRRRSRRRTSISMRRSMIFERSLGMRRCRGRAR